ncbi:glycosyltransferase involved in cell wall biosynthesis [Algoriphagus ratkowskyi]|uniref:Glycosyltransferase family 2 protein n=1 Tax=Algoriphagus ratkowskyi TaxID=57028 RepID=A0A2W7RSW1_9BACT|nr:glycosyltransferase family 2 protein [Algoriphagus ratkowskyi]PZX57619.1 glycosyltransferase involved in cell wall biosynthesis [Algoriphagus ratkowskyi]TXD78892.1 glycosyltransferase family 2 protein [Algoriphagus ratkowskyi]
MKIKSKGITIVIPIYNEEEGIARLLPAFEDYINSSKFEVTILLVNDGSTDNSLNEIKKAAAYNEHVGFISFEKNAGLSAAIRAGFEKSATKWVGYIDADLQTDPMDFLRLEAMIPNYDLVTGRRTGRKDSAVKKMSSTFANWFRDSMLHDGVHDSGCPLKIVRRSVALDMPFFKGMHRFFPALTLIQGKKVIEIPVKHFPRVTGKSKFNVWNRFLSPLQDTLALRWMMKRQSTYTISENSIKSYKAAIHE